MLLKNWLLLLDLDDTCIPNSFRYNDATWKCGLIISQALGHRSPYASDVMKLHYEVDVAAVKQYGFSAERFPTTWQGVYDTLCGRAGVAPDPSIRKEIYDTAAEFREGPFPPFDGVAETLIELRGLGAKRRLVTAGDEKLQALKIESSGLRSLFDSVHITPVDKFPMMEELVKAHDGPAAMIGDSKKSDIAPAKKLGITGIWVPSQTWAFANATDAEPDHTIAHLSELPALLRSIASKTA